MCTSANADYLRIERLLYFPDYIDPIDSSDVLDDDNGSLASSFFDYAFFLGDTNYRINGTGPLVTHLIATHRLDACLNNDQLTAQRRAGHTFLGFSEAPINFPPTFKIKVAHAHARRTSSVGADGTSLSTDGSKSLTRRTHQLARSLSRSIRRRSVSPSAVGQVSADAMGTPAVSAAALDASALAVGTAAPTTTAAKATATAASRITEDNARDRPIDDLIRADHASVKDLWSRFQAAGADVPERRRVANELIREVAVHSVAEELVVYPEIRALVGDTVVDKLIADQLAVKRAAYELDKMDVTDPEFAPRLQRIMADLETHMAEEESDELPMLRDRLARDRLVEIGKQFDGIKAMVPTRPHPDAPTQPGLEALVGMMTAPLDKMRDMAREFAERKVK
ncbi:hypothetical protein AMAG_09442 [Allomyces macrogynus ATCC 38327]|uniref:Uncharacterized protein n=1 Tax=Allomyces macrogynus (strain ATCC 38327) TaxID=578462 RepID=A0A0L0SPX3_ALLM3|nr:hypothetical protein AMAG_09442 [Allomyces macrogynus ATCC 38327]|eukprot:KNE64420.1 hypothetical protein AMAG_09442 [Allomyces macrogynus ATCC 38327]